MEIKKLPWRVCRLLRKRNERERLFLKRDLNKNILNNKTRMLRVATYYYENAKVTCGGSFRIHHGVGLEHQIRGVVGVVDPTSYKQR